jgi:peptide/nickel transport system substrate-binding protein
MSRRDRLKQWLGQPWVGLLRVWLRQRWLKGALLVGLCGLLAISCQSTPANLSPGNRDRIVVGTTASVSTIDPADAYSTFTGTLLYNLGDRLYTYQLGGTQLVPQLAAALPKVSGDGLIYTIPLRQGVQFHDGTPFDAAAMAFSLNRFIQNGGSPAFLLSDFVATVQASQPFELIIKLKKPFAAFPSLLAFAGACAVSPKAYEIKEGAFNPTEFVGTGPYRLTRFGTDQLRLEAFDRYWGEKPKNSGIDIQFFSSTANLFNAFRTRAVDLAYQDLAVDQVRLLQTDAAANGWQVIEKSGSGVNYLTLNLKSPPLDQVRVRQILAAVIDRPLLQSRVFQGQVDPLYSLIPSSLGEAEPVFQAYGDRNIDQAEEWLEEAGYSAENPLKLEFWYRSNVTNDNLVALTTRAVAKKSLGDRIQIDLKSVESTTAYKNLDKGAYPIFLLNWSPDFLDPDNYIQPFLECAQGSPQEGCTDGSSFLQGSFYYSAQANQLIDQSRKAQDPAQRRQIFAQLQTLLAQEVPFIPLWQSKDYLFAQPGITGASLEVTQKVPFASLAKPS